MGDNSKIEWTDATWNPILGCDKISPGCKNCYAIRTAYRMMHNPNAKIAAAFEGLTVLQGGQPNWTGRINFVEDRLLQPLAWTRPRRIFVNSQSDLFHEGVSDEQIDQIFAVMAVASQHTFQVLTKRPERMLSYLTDEERAYAIGAALGNMLDGEWIWKEGKRFRKKIEHLISLAHGYEDDDERQASSHLLPLKNVWLGTSVESPKYKSRINILRTVPAAVRMVSLEPLIEDLGALDLREIQWVITGFESGPNARPGHPDWARGVRDQCVAAKVAFLHKQNGEWSAIGKVDRQPKHYIWVNRDGRNTRDSDSIVTGQGWQCMCWIGKKAAGRMLDGRTWDEYPGGNSSETGD